MTNHLLRIETAIGAMSILKDGSLNGDFSAFGISEAEYLLLVGPTPWHAQDRGVVRRTLDAMIFGVMDVTGVPRFNPPFEYIAAVISCFVSGANVMIACRWIEGGQRAEELLAGKGEIQNVTAEQMFAFICMLRGADPAVREQFDKKVGFAIKQATKAARAA